MAVILSTEFLKNLTGRIIIAMFLFNTNVHYEWDMPDIHG